MKFLLFTAFFLFIAAASYANPVEDSSLLEKLFDEDEDETKVCTDVFSPEVNLPPMISGLVYSCSINGRGIYQFNLQ